jgi:predicted neutral ceramidase superfamily lipid hydrolase
MFFSELGKVFIEFLYAPFIYPDMFWIILPLFLSIGLMELYFKKYSREGIGHHKSLENTIFLVFICFNLVYFISTHESTNFKKIFVGIYVLFCLIIAFMDFMHKLPTKLIFKRSSKSVVAFISYIVIILTYSRLLNDFSLYTLIMLILGAVMLFIVYLVIRITIKFLQPKSYDDIESFLKHIEEDIKKAHEETDEIEIDYKKSNNNKIAAPKKKT